MKDGRTKDEFCSPKPGLSPADLLRVKGRWKVTARYVPHTRDGEIRCVRVRVGCGPTVHYSQDEFDRLFQPEKPDGT